jgi:hypothetical protein
MELPTSCPGAPLALAETTLGVQIGVDIGQRVDFTAIVVAEVYTAEAPPPVGRETHYRVQDIRRLDLGIDYVAIAAYLIALLCSLRDWEVDKRKHDYEARLERWDRRAVRWPVDLYVDGTGVGKPVVDMVRRMLKQDPRTERASLHDIRITHSDRYDAGADPAMLGKAYMVSNMQRLFQQDLVHIPRSSPEVEQMVTELKQYEIRLNDNGTDIYGVFGNKTHDDLATALGLACLEDPAASRIEAGPIIW